MTFPAWFSQHLCGKPVIGWLCTRPKKHGGQCGYQRKKFAHMEERYQLGADPDVALVKEGP